VAYVHLRAISCRCPAQNRIGRHNRRHLPQQTTAETSPPPRQTAPLLVAESESSARELTPEDAILLDQIGDDVLLLVIQPVGQGGQNNPDEHAVNHGAESTLATGLRASQLCRRACGTLRESLEDSENLPDPDVSAAEIVEDLKAALEQFAEIQADLAATRLRRAPLCAHE